MLFSSINTDYIQSLLLYISDTAISHVTKTVNHFHTQGKALIKNTSTRYGLFSVVLHWSTTLILYSLFGLGLYMTSLSYYDSLYHTVPWWHKSFGLLVIFFFFLRLFWNKANIKPNNKNYHSNWEKKTAFITHFILQAFILIICVSGYLISTSSGSPIEFFGLFDVPSVIELNAENTDLAGEVHFYIAWGLIILSTAHAVAALKHHFIDRDNTLKNMVFREK